MDELVVYQSFIHYHPQLCQQGAGEMFGAAIMSVKRAGTAATLLLMLFLLTGGYYVQVYTIALFWYEYFSHKK